MIGTVDVHQHLWTPGFMDVLRSRTTTPRLADNIVLIDGQPPFPLDLATEETRLRAGLATADGLDTVLLGPSSPLGLEWLAADEAAKLFAAWHDDVVALPSPFGCWAGAPLAETDPHALRDVLDRGAVGLQLPATALGEPTGWQACAPLLDVLLDTGRPLFIHPGAAPPDDGTHPGWWPAVVDYVGQMHRAWYAFRVAGRPAYPQLRVCFALLAGLAPLHAERVAARGGGSRPVDRLAFLETSSYGPRAVDAIGRAVGLDVLVHGSDRPYAEPAHLDLEPAALHALRIANPARLLGGRS